MPNDSAAQANVVFDAPLKYWGGEWYFLQNRPLNLAQLAVIEFREIERSDPGKAINYLMSLAPKTDPNIDLAHLKKLYEDPKFDVKQIKHLHAVFEQVNRISLALLNVFQLGFHSNPRFGRLEYSKKYPPVHVNKTLARQITRDILMLETAFFQRQRRHFQVPLGLDEEGKVISSDNVVSVEGHLLYMADLLAYDALKPLKEERQFSEEIVKKSIIPENTVAITYMRERINIRLIPYYPLVLIGIPTALSNDWYKPPLDFLVIPHEVGHYLYQYGIYEDKKYPYPGKTLLQRQTMELGKEYPMNDHYLIFQEDGNLVVYNKDKQFVWGLHDVTDSYTRIKRIAMQDDGNFAAYDAHGDYVWSALHVNPDPNARLILTPEGRLQLYSDERGLLWSSENPKTIEAELSDRLAKQGIDDPSDWRKRWLEEIFADCYGVIVAGPIAILAIQEMLASRQFVDLDNELGTGEHPIPLLRPLILTNFLEQLSQEDNGPSYLDSAKNLEEHWHNYLSNYDMLMSEGILAEKHAIQGIESDKTGKEILNDLKAITQEILELFKATFPKDNSIWDWEKKWSHDTQGQFSEDGQSVNCMNTLLKDYANVLVENNYSRIISPPEIAKPDLNFFGGRIHDKTPDQARLIETPFTRDLSWVQQVIVKEDSRVEQGKVRKLLGEEDWLKAFLVKGWTDEGGDSHLRP